MANYSGNLRFKIGLSIIVLLCLASATSATTLYVDDDGGSYTSIQDAVNSASRGDTVVVHPGKYSSVTIDKQLTIRGENYPITSGITVNKDNCVVKGFTVYRSYNGIMVNSNSNRIEDNILLRSNYGVYISEASGNVLKNNVFVSNSKGIYLDLSPNNRVANNYLNDNGEAIFLDNSDSNLIIGNVAGHNSREGVYLVFSWGNVVLGNKIFDNSKGAFLLGSSYNDITQNTFYSGYYGVALIDYNPLGSVFIPSENNNIYLNNIMDYDIYAATYSVNNWNSYNSTTYNYNGKQYTSRLGNYWGDLKGRDYDNDGIMDSNGYYIDEQNKDNYPLAAHWETYLGETYNLPPYTTFTYSPTTPTAGSVEFSANGNGDKYIWNFGDGASKTTTSSTVSHTYSAGTFTVKLTVVDDGERNSVAKVITVEPPDTTPPTTTSLTPLDGHTIKESSVTINLRTDEKLSDAVLKWDATSYHMEGSGTYWHYTVDAQNGEHTYSVTVWDPANNEAQSEERTITVSNPDRLKREILTDIVDYVKNPTPTKKQEILQKIVQYIQMR